MSLIKNLWLKPTVLLVLLLKYKVNIIARSISLMLSLTENHKISTLSYKSKYLIKSKLLSKRIHTLSGTP